MMSSARRDSNSRNEPSRGRVGAFLKKGLAPAGRLLRRGGNALRPGYRIWRGATWGTVAVTALALGVISYYQLVASTAHPNWAGLLVIAAFVVVPVLAGLAVLLLARGIVTLPAVYRRVAVPCAAILMLMVSFQVKPLGVLLAVVLGVVGASVLGGGLVAVLNRNAAWPNRVVGAAAVATAVGFFAATIGWMLDPGEISDRDHLRVTTAGAPQLDLPDPSRSGSYEVRTATYGSGEDRHRAAFADEADLLTEPVDGSRLLDGWEGPAGWARTRYWGFGPEQLPLQGRVWYPAGEGPFPLVLIVHGNHAMEDFSDTGYAYLGEQLASRGFIFVSVDENFLNGSVSDLLGGMEGGLDEENDARGWLLLEHLRVWHAWNREPGNRFHGLVDTDRIGLIGHSRGGEAVAVAAAFNRLSRYPDNGSLAFDYGFDLKAVAAIAPVDGQYEPAEIGIPLQDIDYFALQGAHDADMDSFEGTKQFDRVEFSDGTRGFKSAVYVAEANHGQFNSSWGRFDTGQPFGWLLNVAPLMEAEKQQQVAKVYLGAFLEASLNGRRGYLPMLRDYRYAAHWLPETTYLGELELAGSRPVANFEEDLDLASTTLAGGTITQQGLADWREQRVDMRDGLRDSRAAYLGWNANESKAARYTVQLPPGTTIDPERALTLSVADVGNSPSSGDDEGSDGANAPDAIDFTVELVDRAGHKVEMPLSDQNELPRAFEPRLVKSSLVDDPPGPEPVFQTYVWPFEDLRSREREFEPEQLERISLVFDRTRSGLIALNEVAFRDTLREE